MKPAVLWDKAAENKVHCRLCNHRCTIAAGKRGFCGVRQNVDGTLYSLNCEQVCAANPDPVEKKPLFHFQPGSRSFSIACPGCNFKCEFCQNWHISQLSPEQMSGRPYTPEQIVQAALESRCSSIAYTYTEPTIFMELCCECGRLAKEKGMMNVFVSNGYMTTDAIDFASEWLDAINVDLKSFREDYYRNLCKARLQPVLETLEYIAHHTDIWLEVTTLVVPQSNDSDEELQQIANFISQKLGPQVPWHVSRFYPNYQMDHEQPTPAEILQRACEIGKQAGLHYIYVGNLPGTRSESTYCHKCGELLIDRVGYRIVKNRLENGACWNCGQTMAGLGLT